MQYPQVEDLYLNCGCYYLNRTLDDHLDEATLSLVGLLQNVRATLVAGDLKNKTFSFDEL